MLWLVLAVVLSVYVYLKVVRPLTYWKNKGVVCEKSWPILGAAVPVVFKQKPLIQVLKDSYRAFPNERYYGYHQFMKPALMIRDLDLIKRITVKDFDHFTDRNPIVSQENDRIMSNGLFSAKGQFWRSLRTTLSPSFTGTKMRAMFVLLVDCAQQFTQYYDKNSCEDVMTLEMKEEFSRFMNDAIASTAFGVKIDSLQERNNEFYLMGKETIDFKGWRTARFILRYILSSRLNKYFNMPFFPKRVTDFFISIVKDALAKREALGIVRPDMIHLLMEARKGRLKHENIQETIDTGFATVKESSIGKTVRSSKVELSDEDITAQVLTFFIAGFDTSSTLMSSMAYELAVNPNIQEQLQEEIDMTLQKCHGQITYESLVRMIYLDMVISEALRKWPSAIHIDRVCEKDYIIEPKRPHETSLLLRKGDMVVIPLVAIHHDPNLFPDPDTFDPERFSEENKKKIEPASYMPFGAGPRSCIASRLALLTIKTLFFHLLSKFNIKVVSKTLIPMRVAFSPFNLAPSDGMWLELEQRKSTQY